MMTLAYRGVALLVLLLVARCMVREKDFWKQVTGALVLVPLILRILMIK
jgi:ABC-type molybdate transport system permease subunit